MAARQSIVLGFKPKIARKDWRLKVDFKIRVKGEANCIEQGWRHAVMCRKRAKNTSDSLIMRLRKQDVWMKQIKYVSVPRRYKTAR